MATMKEYFIIKVKHWHTGKDQYYWSVTGPYISPYVDDIRCAERFETFDTAKEVIERMKGPAIYQIDKIFCIEE